MKDGGISPVGFGSRIRILTLHPSLAIRSTRSKNEKAFGDYKTQLRRRLESV